MSELLVTVMDPIPAERLERMRTLLPEGFRLEVARSRAQADQLAAVARSVFAISGDMPVNEAVFAAAPGLRAVHKWGVGVDNFDLDAAKRAGVRILRTTGSNARPVAETALGMMLALQRSLFTGDQAVRAGQWPKAELGARTFKLTGSTVGLLGMGAIARNLAHLLAGFGCRLLYTKPTPLPAAEEAELGLTRVGLDELLAESDVLSLHCPLTPETRGLIGLAQLRRMKSSAILINTGRGGIVDEAALLTALEEGLIRGAGLDVFATEPLPADDPLRRAPNLILAPHIGGQAADNFAPTVSRMFKNLADLAAGREVAALDVVL